MKFKHYVALFASFFIAGIFLQPTKANSEFHSLQKNSLNGQAHAVTINSSETGYSLTVISDHGLVIRSPDQALYQAGDTVRLTAAADPGYVFDHWSNSSSGDFIFPEGAVAISFDDGNASVYNNYFPIMKAKGIPGTAYIISSWINTPGYMTTAQLLDLAANGWAIANHTWDHVLLSSLSEVEQEAELLSCKNYLEGLGLTGTSDQVAYPEGKWNADTLIAMANSGMLTGRTVAPFLFHAETVDPYQIPSGIARSLYEAKKYTDQAVANRQIDFTHAHYQGSYSDMPLADFQAWTDYLVSNHIPTLTINDIFPRTNTSIDITIQADMSITANYIYMPVPTPDTLSPDGTIASTLPTYTWNAANNASDYDFDLFSYAAGDTILSVAHLPASSLCTNGMCSYTPTLSLSGIDYRFRVRAWNGVESSSYSRWKVFSIGQAPAAPASLSPNSVVFTDTPTFRWTSSQGASYYDLNVFSASPVNLIYSVNSLSASSVCSSGDCVFSPAQSLASGHYYFNNRGWNLNSFSPNSANTYFTVLLANNHLYLPLVSSAP